MLAGNEALLIHRCGSNTSLVLRVKYTAGKVEVMVEVNSLGVRSHPSTSEFEFVEDLRIYGLQVYAKSQVCSIDSSYTAIFCCSVEWGNSPHALL